MSFLGLNIVEDTAEYERLCMLYDEEIQLYQDMKGKWHPKCYSTHAIKLKQKYQEEQQ